MSNYFVPPCNSKNDKHRQRQPQSTSHPIPPQHQSGGGYSQTPPQTRQGGVIPPPVGAMRASGQKVEQCERCRELLPLGTDYFAHVIGCGAAEVITKSLTPYDYPPRQNHNTGYRR